MDIVGSGDLSGASDTPNFLIARGNAAGSFVRLTGGDHDDVILAGLGPVVMDTAANATLQTAIDLDSSGNWARDNNPIVGDATVPTTTVFGHAGGSAVDWFSFTASAGSQITLDIDFADFTFAGEGLGGPAWDPVIFLYDSNGTQVAANDDNLATLGGAGSVVHSTDSAQSRDPFLTIAAPSTGRYYVMVQSFTGAIPAGDNYVLNVSVTGHQATGAVDPAAVLIDGGAGNDYLVGTAGNETIDAGSGLDYVFAGAGDDLVEQETSVSGSYLDGGAGNDTLVRDPKTGSFNTQSATIDLHATLQASGVTIIGIENVTTGVGGDTITGDAGNNVLESMAGTNGVTLNGAEGDDTLIWSVAVGGDLDGGSGNDLLRIYNQLIILDLRNGTMTSDTAAAMNFTGFERVETSGVANIFLAPGISVTSISSSTDTFHADHTAGGRIDGGALTDLFDLFNFGTPGQTVQTDLAAGTSDAVAALLNFEDVRGGAGNDVIGGTSGDNNLDGRAGNDTLMGRGGNDQLIGGAGNDLLDGGLGADAMAGGADDDTYIVDNVGDAVTEIANEGIADEVRTSLTTYVLPANVEKLTYSGTAAASLSGNSGNNIIVGGLNGDLFNLGQGGNDTVNGGAGDDGFYFGAAYTNLDSIDGGPGTLDQIGLRGDYSGPTTLGTITEVENVVVFSGANARFGGVATDRFSYNIVLTEASVAAGQTLYFSANTLLSGENFRLDASAETDGSVITYGGFGNETLIGGSQNDGFFFGAGRWGNGDIVNGGGGSLDQVAIQGNYIGAGAITFGAGQLVAVEHLIALSGATLGQTFSYDLTLDNANVAAGAFFAVTANQLGAAETLTLNASAEADAAITVYSGAGADTIIGGQLGDAIYGGAGADRITGGRGADMITGGAGNDTFLYTNVLDSTAAAQDTIQDFQSGDKIDLSGLAAFTFVAGAFTGQNQIHVVDNGNGTYTVEAETTGDTVADMSVLVRSDHALTASDFVGVTPQAAIGDDQSGRPDAGTPSVLPPFSEVGKLHTAMFDDFASHQLFAHAAFQPQATEYV